VLRTLETIGGSVVSCETGERDSRREPRCHIEYERFHWADARSGSSSPFGSEGPRGRFLGGNRGSGSGDWPPIAREQFAVCHLHRHGGRTARAMVFRVERARSAATHRKPKTVRSASAGRLSRGPCSGRSGRRQSSEELRCRETRGSEGNAPSLTGKSSRQSSRASLLPATAADRPSPIVSVTETMCHRSRKASSPQARSVTRRSAYVPCSP